MFQRSIFPLGLPTGKNHLPDECLHRSTGHLLYIFIRFLSRQRKAHAYCVCCIFKQGGVGLNKVQFVNIFYFLFLAKCIIYGPVDKIQTLRHYTSPGCSIGAWLKNPLGIFLPPLPITYMKDSVYLFSPQQQYFHIHCILLCLDKLQKCFLVTTT